MKEQGEQNQYDLFNQPARPFYEMIEHISKKNVEVDVLHQKENNSVSQANLDANRAHFSNQCKKAYKALMQGTVIDWKYGKDFDEPIVDIQRRIRDLDAAGIQITKFWVKPSNRKILNYYMTPEQREYNVQKFGLEL